MGRPRLPRGKDGRKMPVPGGRARHRRNMELKARQQAEQREVVMPDDEKTYRERLETLAAAINKLHREGYFLGGDGLREKLRDLDEQARAAVAAPIPDYNATTGAAEALENC